MCPSVHNKRILYRALYEYYEKALDYCLEIYGVRFINVYKKSLGSEKKIYYYFELHKKFLDSGKSCSGARRVSIKQMSNQNRLSSNIQQFVPHDLEMRHKYARIHSKNEHFTILAETPLSFSTFYFPRISSGVRA